MEIQILGPLEVRNEGKTVALGGPQPQRLLAALLSHPNRAVSADRLAQELWGPDAPGAAANTVQVHVSRLRKRLVNRIETTQRPAGYRLRVEPGELDAERFGRMVEQANQAMSAGAPERAGRLLHAALDMWRGEPFDGLDLGPLAKAEADRLAENRRDARDARVAADLGAGLHRSLVGELQCELDLDPTDEAVAIPLMLALYRCNRQRGANEIFTRVSHALAELGLTPGPELQAMQRRILSHDPALDFAPPSPAPGAARPLPPVLRALPRPRAPIVGRDAELERLHQIVVDAAAGSRRVVLIEGEAGVGKTRLAAETAIAAHDQGFAVGWGASAEGLSAPYSVWHDALSHLVSHMTDERVAEHLAAYGNTISHLLPSFDRVSAPSVDLPSSTRPGAMVSAPGTERDLLFAAVARLLRTLCADQPVALVLDDMHWANPQSLRLLRYVAGDTPDLPLLLIATFRDRGMPKAYPVRAMHADLRRLPDAEPPDGAAESDGAVVSLGLRRLDPSQVRALISAIAGHDLGPGERELADALSEETAGTPFFVREVLRHLRASGKVDKDAEGRWRLLRPISEFDLPQSVHDVVARRVDELGPDASSVLSAASVIGRNFDARLLARLVDLGEERVEGILETASQGQLLAELEAPPKHYSFEHACFQHSLYAQFRPRERARRHVAVARALEACDRGDPVERAHHWVTAGDPDHADEAVHYARRAGERALEQLAADDAVRWFEAARGRTENDDAQLCDILTQLGVAQRQVGRPFGDTLQEACEIAERIGDHRRLARAVVANTPGPFGAAGRAAESRIDWLNRALAALPEDAGERPLIKAVLGKELYFGGHPTSGAGICRQGLEEARTRYARITTPRGGTPRDPDDVPVSAKRELADVLAYATVISPMGPPDDPAAREHVALVAELADLAEQLDDPELRFELASDRFIRGMLVGDPDELDAGLLTMHDLARSRVPILRWAELWSASARRLVEGNLGAAERLSEEAAALARSRGVANGEVVAFGQRVGIAAERGSLEDLADDAARLARAHPELPLLQLARAFIAAETGRHEAAADGLRRVAKRGYTFSYPQTRAACLARCTEIALKLGERLQYQVLYDKLERFKDQFATPAGITSRGSIHLSLARLAAALGQGKKAEWHFREAEQAHDRLGAPLMQARTYLARGEALLAREPDRAMELLREARELAKRYGGTATVAEAERLLERIREQGCAQPFSALLS